MFNLLSPRLANFDGARVVVVTNSGKRVVNIIKKVPLHPALLKQEAFLFSYFDETSQGAFGCRYAVPTILDEEMVIKTRLIEDIFTPLGQTG